MCASVLLILLSVFAIPASAYGQLQHGTVQGTVLAPDGGPAAGRVVLVDDLGTTLDTTETTAGRFVFRNVPPGTYGIQADSAALRSALQRVHVTSALPVEVQLRLAPRAAEQVVVQGEDQAGASPMTRVTLAGDAIRQAPSRIRSRGVQAALASAAGWATEDNGLLHVRGVDDGFLYVVDGVPVYERIDTLSGIGPEAATIDALTVITGYIPPEFGWKAGGVIDVRSAAGVPSGWDGSIDVSAASARTLDGAAIAAGPAGPDGVLTLGSSAVRSDRFLDPVHPENFHNTGASWSGTAQYGWRPTPGRTLTATGAAGRAAFDMPHGDEQEEAQQDQRQRLTQYAQSVSWQQATAAGTVVHLTQYFRSGASTVAGSAQDVPVFTDASRTLRRAGLLAAVAHGRGRHLLKAGAELSALRLREQFVFAVTDVEEAEEADVSDAALAFTRATPFRFAGTASPLLAAVYAQDSFRASDAVTVDAGVRIDWIRLLAARAQVSPRAGIAWRLDRAGTTLRSSFGRFFQPPQAENLLLASSEAARALSPFVDETGGGGALEPERQTAFEAGVSRRLAPGVRADVVYWRRWMRDVADPNVFFGTTILVPNTVDRGRASGVDVRLELLRTRGLSGYLTYTNARVVQFGPITGGLFLEDDVIEIGPGTAFTPDHDQRHVGAFGLSFDEPGRGFRAAVTGRYESGTPLEVEEDELDELRLRPGADLVDFERGRVAPRAILDATVSQRLFPAGGREVRLVATVLNATGRRFAYNFGNPFSGTHFGPGRTVRVGVRIGL